MKMKGMMTALLWVVAIVASANDGMFYVNGSEITPLQSTDIAVAKEVLTITIGDDHIACVDVQYVFMNHGKAKTVDVGFEAAGPYDPGSENTFNKAGKHPYIFDFTVEMNGEKLPVRNYVMKESNGEEVADYTPLDLNVWTKYADDDMSGLKKKGVDEYIDYSYAYCFKAAFKEGRNVVHHTYRYRMSTGLYEYFAIPYWLMPAMRWANHQIDDFTLRLKVDKSAKHFCMQINDAWKGGQWKLVSGAGKVRKVHTQWAGGGDYMEFFLRNGTYEWHANNFRPTKNIRIVSPECLIFNNPVNFKLGMFYDRGTTIIAPYEMMYGEENETLKKGTTDGIPNKQIIRNIPYASRGYVFKNPKLKAYFSKIWWYIPDPNWDGNTADFTKTDWELINENK